MKKLATAASAVMAVAVLGLAPSALAQPVPQAFWSFDDGANPTSDETGNGHDGTLFGTPTYDGADQPAQLGGGNSLSFNGTSNYIALNMSMSGANSLAQMSASVWFKTTFNTGGNFTNWSFLDFDRSEFFNVFVTGTGGIGFATTASNGGSRDTDDMYSFRDGLNDGLWHHVAVVYDGADKSIYVDGILDSTNVNAHGGRALGMNVTRFAFIGDGSEATAFNGARNNILYDGKLDEVAFWTVPLTPDEVLNIEGGASILTLDVDIDIKPDGEINSINLCSNGSVPIAIFGSDTFDVFDIVNSTLRFAESSVKVVGKKNKELCSYEDVDGDPWIDLVCHFDTTDIAALDGESSMATVNGELTDGTLIEGMDTVNIVKDTCG